ncbi:MAG: CatA-like O-acetyltransferase [Pseudomonadota bacterium]
MGRYLDARRSDRMPGLPMTARPVDRATWPRAAQFDFFRTFERPHFAVTSRIDLSALMAAQPRPSPFRAMIHAIGAGVHAVPELRMRLRDGEAVIHDRLRLSPTIAMENGDFRYAYLDWQDDFSAFDADASEVIAAIRAGGPLNANDGAVDDLAFLSCLPWLDFTAIDNALPHARDSIPRTSWGKIVPKTGGGHDVAVAIQVHHALADGRHVGTFFEEVSARLARFG